MKTPTEKEAGFTPIDDLFCIPEEDGSDNASCTNCGHEERKHFVPEGCLAVCKGGCLCKKFITDNQDDRICPDCGGLIKIRNPTGKCDHLYYPENKGSDNQGCAKCGHDRELHKDDGEKKKVCWHKGVSGYYDCYGCNGYTTDKTDNTNSNHSPKDKPEVKPNRHNKTSGCDNQNCANSK